jgi:Cdc6-like AAA superfamily ATPase
VDIAESRLEVDKIIKLINALATQRRFCDMVGFLDLYGLINARTVSLGRYGKTREITSSLPDKVVKGLV